MSQAKAFGGVLARIRREQGFPTAYSFHKSCEGRRTLGLDHLIDLASLYGNPEAAPGSAVYMVRGQIFKIYPG